MFRWLEWSRSSAACSLAAFSLVVAAGPASAADLMPPMTPVTDATPFGCTTTVPVQVCANDATADSAAPSGNAVFTRLTQLMNQAQSGDLIRISMFAWWYVQVDPDTQQTGSTVQQAAPVEAVTDAVLAAKSRGVDVRVVVDQQSDPASQPELDYTCGQFSNPSAPGNWTGWCRPAPVRELLSGGVPVTVCAPSGTLVSRGATRSECLVDYTGNPKAINHNKLFVFTVAGAKHTVVASMNLVPGSSNVYNNLVHLNGDGRTYDYLYDYWNRMVAGDWQGWDTNLSRQHQGDDPGAGATVKAYVYPHLDGEDTMLNILNKVQSCPSSGDSKVWFAMAQVDPNRLQASNGAILTRVHDLVLAGCTVRFIIGGGGSANSDTSATLLSSQGAKVLELPQGGIPNLHSKYMVVDATSLGMGASDPSQPREYVFTGSQNMGVTAMSQNGESDLWVEQHDAVRRYVANFTCVWNRNHVDAVAPDDDGCQ